MHRRPIIAALLLLVTLLLLSGCSRNRTETVEPVAIRTPLPTFTPTPQSLADSTPEAAPQAQPVAEAAAPAEQSPEQAAELAGTGGPANMEALTPPADSAAPAAVALTDPPLAVINTDLVNSRSGPDTTYPVVVILGRGEEFDVTGKSADGAWFRICCVQGKEAWVSAEFADTDGAVDPVPVAGAGEISQIALATMTATAAPVQVAEAPTATPEPAPAAQPEPTAQPEAAAPAPPQPAATPAAEPVAGAPPAEAVQPATAGAPALELVAQERFPETNVVRVFLYVYHDNDGLEGYTLAVTKDGAPQPVAGSSFGGRPGLTWPIADDRQRFQNLKIEFPGVNAAGTWSIVPMKDGAPAGPAAEFVLAADDPARELYVRYKLP